MKSYSSPTGAILIVAGTAIGAGMLGLPLTSTSIGLPLSLVFLTGFWAITNLSAFLLVELNARLGKTLSIPSLCEEYNFPLLKWLCLIALAGLHTAVLSAYIAGSSDIMRQALPDWPPHLITVGFTFVAGALIRYSRKLTDYSNRAFFICKVIAFSCLIAFLAPYISFSSKLGAATSSHTNISNVLLAIPIYFTSFGFHGSLHSIMKHTGIVSSQNIRNVFLKGSLIALSVYIIWIISTLSVTTGTSTNVALFLEELNLASCNSGVFSLFAQGFALCAIITSFLGVGMGQLDFIKEHVPNERLATYLTFGPPLVFALFYPEGFLIALGYAGVFLSILALIVPSIIALKKWKEPHPDQAPGGLVARAAVLLAGVVIIVCKFM